MNKLTQMIAEVAEAKAAGKIVHDMRMHGKLTTEDMVDTWRAIESEMAVTLPVDRELELHGAATALDRHAAPMTGGTRIDLDHDAYREIRARALTLLSGKRSSTSDHL